MKLLPFAAVALVVAVSVPAFAADTNYKITDRLKMPDGRFDYASSDQARGSIYWPRLDVINIIDAKTNEISNISGAPNGHVAVPIPGTMLVVEPHGGNKPTAEQPNGVAVVDVKTNHVLADLPAGNFPDGGTYDPSSKLAYIALHNDGTLLAIDPRKRTIAATIDVGGHLEFPGADGHGHLFVNIQTAGEIGVIDTKTQKVTAHWKLDGCEDNGGLAVARRSGLVIAACGNGVAMVLTTAGKTVASIPIGHGSDAVIYDSKRQLAFIPCAGEGVLYVLSVADPKHVAVVQQLPTQKGTRTGAVNEASGRVYLMASKPDTASPPGPSGRPNPLAGSFEMLVVSP
jgi:DNA-binding beta-propeller fold protein YncE